MPTQAPAAVIVIPARLSSTRLPRKMLLADTGKTLIEHTWHAARASSRAARVIVATDSEEIAAAVAAFGGEAVMTSESAPSGTALVKIQGRRGPQGCLVWSLSQPTSGSLMPSHTLSTISTRPAIQAGSPTTPV